MASISEKKSKSTISAGKGIQTVVHLHSDVGAVWGETFTHGSNGGERSWDLNLSDS